MKNPLDLKIYTGDYFNQTVFRIALIAILILTTFTMYKSGFDFEEKTSYYCPKNNLNMSCKIEIGCEQKNPVETCIPKETILLAPGQYYGDKPNSLVENYSTTVLVILTAAFTANHVLYLRRNNKL